MHVTVEMLIFTVVADIEPRPEKAKRDMGNLVCIGERDVKYSESPLMLNEC